MKIVEYGNYRLVKDTYKSGAEHWDMYYIVHNWGEREYWYVNSKYTLTEAIEWIDKARS